MDNFKYGYFQIKTASGRTGYVCAALVRPPKGSLEPHVAAFSFCSPKDLFNKSRARELAVDRIKDKGISFNSTSGNTKGAVIDALRAAISQGVVPSWVRKNAKYKRAIVGLTQWTPEVIKRRGRGPETPDFI